MLLLHTLGSASRVKSGLR